MRRWWHTHIYQLSCSELKTEGQCKQIIHVDVQGLLQFAQLQQIFNLSQPIYTGDVTVIYTLQTCYPCFPSEQEFIPPCFYVCKCGFSVVDTLHFLFLLISITYLNRSWSFKLSIIDQYVHQPDLGVYTSQNVLYITTICISYSSHDMSDD